MQKIMVTISRIVEILLSLVSKYNLKTPNNVGQVSRKTIMAPTVFLPFIGKGAKAETQVKVHQSHMD